MKALLFVPDERCTDMVLNAIKAWGATTGLLKEIEIPAGTEQFKYYFSKFPSFDTKIESIPLPRPPRPKVKKIGWVNLYETNDGKHCARVIWDTEETARKYGHDGLGDTYSDTVQITYEVDE